MPTLLKFPFRAISISLLLGSLCFMALTAVVILCFLDDDDISTKSCPRPLAFYAWSVGQWCMWLSPQLSSVLTHKAWRSMEKITRREGGQGEALHHSAPILEIPTLSVQDFVENGNSDNPLDYLRKTYGSDWRERPLLLRGLWDPAALQMTTNATNQRRLSTQGLLQMNLTIPYFSDARVHGALKPDATSKVQDIVQRIMEGHPHKIGSQFIVQHDPSLLDEVAPQPIVTELFGDYFTKKRLLGHGKTFGIFPGITTVPVFVANGNSASTSTAHTDTCNRENDDKVQKESSPFTGLHCEPIANVAVQLSGFRRWTLVDPNHSWLLRPAISNDGRSFYPSWATSIDHVPRYEIITYPGDAVFVPTWTWHRVDYVESGDLSIGASLFHFRAMDFLRRNPLFALLLIPALFGELVGISSQ